MLKWCKIESEHLREILFNRDKVDNTRVCCLCLSLFVANLCVYIFVTVAFLDRRVAQTNKIVSAKCLNTNLVKSVVDSAGSALGIVTFYCIIFTPGNSNFWHLILDVVKDELLSKINFSTPIQNSNLSKFKWEWFETIWKCYQFQNSAIQNWMPKIGLSWGEFQVLLLTM